ncbi:unnamed protein product [Prorocentrum cordatum]|uniref:V-type proton ATPase subunit G n=1 Tax=Prorocentrum cordatum TaxID=2364126 RepID=A0ABN9Y566_9DINO|nr:unnamed protein product [Polarella glacialis]
MQELQGLTVGELKAMAAQADKDIKEYARSRCKKKAMEEMKKKQRIEKEIARLEGCGADDATAGASRTTALLDVCDEKTYEEEYEKIERQVTPDADATQVEEVDAGAAAPAADAGAAQPEASLINAPELPDTFRRNSIA